MKIGSFHHSLPYVVLDILWTFFFGISDDEIENDPPKDIYRYKVIKFYFLLHIITKIKMIVGILLYRVCNDQYLVS